MKTSKLFICTIILSAITYVSCMDSSVLSYVKKIIIDTDAGVDDAIAIIMAVEAERLGDGPEILAITCVNGNTHVDGVTLNVLKTLKAADRLNIPVYKGAAHPLLLPDQKDYYFGRDGFGDFYYPDPPSTSLIREEHAVNAMIELVKSNPGEVTLLALGPLTNVALAIRLYPSFLENLQQLIVLGGSTEGLGNVRPGIEFNFFIDPVATFVVFNSRTSRLITLIPFEEAKRVRMSKDFKTAMSRLNNRKTWLISSAMATHVNSEDDSSSYTDAVATIVALTSGSIVTKSATFYADIVYYGTITAGIIIVDHQNITGNAPNVNLINNINVEEFERLSLRYFSC